MKIIDKNKDFYDYYQGIYPDDTNTFDRRDSYILSKEEFMRWIKIDRYIYPNKTTHGIEKLALLQIGYTYWLLHITITKWNSLGDCLDYTMEVLHQWKNYDRPRQLIHLAIIKYSFLHLFEMDKVDGASIKKWVDEINLNQVKFSHVFNKFSLWVDNVEYEKHIPILRELGFAKLLNPLDVYLALDEYFSSIKKDEERTETIGLTNNDKIVNHGFDTKSSFRGKNNEKH